MMRLRKCVVASNRAADDGCGRVTESSANECDVPVKEEKEAFRHVFASKANVKKEKSEEGAKEEKRWKGDGEKRDKFGRRVYFLWWPSTLLKVKVKRIKGDEDLKCFQEMRYKKLKAEESEMGDHDLGEWCEHVFESVSFVFGVGRAKGQKVIRRNDANDVWNKAKQPWSRESADSRSKHEDDDCGRVGTNDHHHHNDDDDDDQPIMGESKWPSIWTALDL